MCYYILVFAQETFWSCFSGLEPDKRVYFFMELSYMDNNMRDGYWNIQETTVLVLGALMCDMQIRGLWQ